MTLRELFERYKDLNGELEGFRNEAEYGSRRAIMAEWEKCQKEYEQVETALLVAITQAESDAPYARTEYDSLKARAAVGDAVEAMPVAAQIERMDGRGFVYRTGTIGGWSWKQGATAAEALGIAPEVKP